MRRHRTTARGVLLLLLATGLPAGDGAPRGPATASTAPIVFPVVGAGQYTDDFGARGRADPHEGNDIMAPRSARSRVAAEAGKVKFWTTSASAGCMLYLYGASGTTYYYIHLNNDLTGRTTTGASASPGRRTGPG